MNPCERFSDPKASAYLSVLNDELKTNTSTATNVEPLKPKVSLALLLLNFTVERPLHSCLELPITGEGMTV